ncbi:DNRLRE domain-containing protein [Streptomyces lasalocidi]|uniref:DNRLRE domain-containing protein n=1 Tax=Streptomyces lasalocidi TaxID=324833 RepID=A0A4U5WMQ4_STRLS|nr:DNRLRE domain-containing protein [Streptomyces lasalocidi]TKT03448.1 DNRLRE domain-containing protein [Streptomyces lasalocidi]
MSSTPVKVTNGIDTWVRQNRPSDNLASTTQLEFSNLTGKVRYAYLTFAQPFPKGVTILSAKLRLTTRYAESTSRTVTLKKITQGWMSTKVTWNNKPAVTNTDAKTLTKSTSPQYTVWEFDVTSHMQAVADGALWFGWRIETSNASSFAQFYSANASVSGRSVKPTLEVVYIEKPSKPTQLAPAGGRVTALAKPVLRFDFTDAQGSTTMQGFQVQMNATNSFTSPSFDTGTVLASVPQLDLNDTAFAGLSDGQTIYWRVRVQDDSGLWSAWSDATSFTRRVKPTLTILNPPANVIDEPTPPIIWSLTGGTQTAWQVIVKNDNGDWLHTSGKTTSTDTDYTIPAGVIKYNNVNYGLEVRVWDTYNRESTPGDTAWIAAAKTVSYAYDATTDPVTSLTATLQYPKPVVTLTWQRSLAPDSFVVRRDGEIIKAYLEPVDALVSGTTYEYVDYDASPGRTHTYSVDAVVNGKTSSGSPTVTITPKTVGIWLMDPDEDIYVQILDADEGTWNMGEEAGIFSPLGGTKSVRVTQALRGYEGSLSGRIAETPDSLGTIQEQEEDIWKLKSRPGKTYTLALSDISMKVVIGNVVVAPLPTRETIKKVSFEFWAQEVPFQAEM